MTRIIAVSRASLVRWWYQRERAWWRRRQVSQCAAVPGGGGRASRRPVSGTVCGIMPGSAGGSWCGSTGAGGWVSVRRRSRAAVTAQMARAAMTSTVCPGGDPFPGADQRVPGAFPYIYQVHGVDSVGHLARAAQVLPLHPRGAASGLDLAGFVDRADGQAAPPPGPAGGLIQPGHGEPAYHRHRRGRVPDGAAEQPLGLIRRVISHLRGDGPPIALGDLAHHRGGVLARLQPRLGPRKTWPQQFLQLSAFPARQRGAYPGGSSRLRFCCPHKRMIDRRLRRARPLPSRSGPRSKPQRLSWVSIWEGR